MIVRSWKAEMLVGDTWHSNELRFATESEAKAYALGLFMRWTIPDDWRAAPSEDEPNYAADDNGIATRIGALS